MPGEEIKSPPDLEDANLSPDKPSAIQSHRLFVKSASRLMGQSLPRLELDESSTSSDSSQSTSSEDVYTCEEKLVRLTSTNALTCDVLSLLEWCILAFPLILFLYSICFPKAKQLMICRLLAWKWCVMVAAVFSARLVTGLVINIIFRLMEKIFLRKKKTLYLFYGVKSSFQFFIGSGAIFAQCKWIFHNAECSVKAMEILDIISRIVLAFFIGSVIWFLKTLAVKLLATSFHANSVFDRIQESIIRQFILQVLSGQPVDGTLQNMDSNRRPRRLSFVKPSKGRREELRFINVLKLGMQKSKNLSAWTTAGLVSATRTSRFLRISNMIDNTWMEVTDESAAKAAAHKIFENVAKYSTSHIQEEDLSGFFTKKELELTLLHFKGALRAGKIEKSAFIKWVEKAYSDRKSLACSLNDMKTAVKHLHWIASMTASIIVICISVFVMGFVRIKYAWGIFSVVAVSLAFGDTFKNFVDSILFLFIDHPFDVGDRVIIDGREMMVDEMAIRSTTFVKPMANGKTTLQNMLLATKPVSNIFRSPDMGDALVFSIDFPALSKSISDLKTRIESFIESKPQHWRPNHSLVVTDGGSVNQLTLALYVTHSMNFQNIEEKDLRRKELFVELEKILDDLSIRSNLETSNPVTHWCIPDIIPPVDD